ncbi:hypothetical protein HPB48_014009 [Haemaphysalis longicornis]|uniref:Uncharacterized protein n=1 Tax=Haemaphysalis longicornis TaxID=44386 RepID=A0A9J6G8C1_HAELO|nr:hypothetical protein HPB48_014009 [Haemaphysalis longicornis]
MYRARGKSSVDAAVSTAHSNPHFFVAQITPGTCPTLQSVRRHALVTTHTQIPALRHKEPVVESTNANKSSPSPGATAVVRAPHFFEACLQNGFDNEETAASTRPSEGTAGTTVVVACKACVGQQRGDVPAQTAGIGRRRPSRDGTPPGEAAWARGNEKGEHDWAARRPANERERWRRKNSGELERRCPLQTRFSFRLSRGSDIY